MRGLRHLLLLAVPLRSREVRQVLLPVPLAVASSVLLC